jgi:hypothetical protein
MAWIQIEHRSLSDVIDFSNVTKADIQELDKLLVQFSKDLYQVFTFYSKRTNGSMSNGEFWRFVRDCKLGLKFTALSILNTHHHPRACTILIHCCVIVDLVFIRVTKTSEGNDAKSSESSAAINNELQNLQKLADDVARSMENEENGMVGGDVTNAISGVDDGQSEMSIADQERLAESHRVSGLKDITFQQFGEALIRLSVIKYPRERSLSHRFKSLLLGFVLPNASKSYNKNMSYLQVKFAPYCVIAAIPIEIM